MFSRSFLKGNLSLVVSGVALGCWEQTVYLTENTVLQAVSHSYGLREGPCQLVLVT